MREFIIKNITRSPMLSSMLIGLTVIIAELCFGYEKIHSFINTNSFFGFIFMVGLSTLAILLWIVGLSIIAAIKEANEDVDEEDVDEEDVEEGLRNYRLKYNYDLRAMLYAARTDIGAVRKETEHMEFGIYQNEKRVKILNKILEKIDQEDDKRIEILKKLSEKA